MCRQQHTRSGWLCGLSFDEKNVKTEQQMIDRLKNRKYRSVSYGAGLFICALALILYMIQYERGLSAIQEIGTKQFNPTISTKHLAQLTHQQITLSMELSVVLSRIYTMSTFIASLAGLFLAALIIELSGRNKDRILIRLWDEIENLKKDRRT